MWFKVESKRGSTGQKFVVRCASRLQARPWWRNARCRRRCRPQGRGAARRQPERDGDGLRRRPPGRVHLRRLRAERRRGRGASPVIKRLFTESAAASLSLKDQLIAESPKDSIRGFASLAASLGYFVSPTQAGEALRRAANRLRDAVSRVLRRRRTGRPESSGQRGDAGAARRKLCETPGWTG